MSIFSRIKNTIASNVNTIVDKTLDAAENPERMTEQMLRESRKNLSRVQKQITALATHEKEITQQMQECQQKIDTHLEAAQRALKAGKEEDARKLLTAKAQFAKEHSVLQQQYDEMHGELEKMRPLAEKLTRETSDLEKQVNSIKRTAATAKARDVVTKMSSGPVTDTISETMARMKQKANGRLSQAQIKAELAQNAAEETDLLSTYGSDASSEIDDELEALRNQMNS